jgi:hypothetical protein
MDNSELMQFMLSYTNSRTTQLETVIEKPKAKAKSKTPSKKGTIAVTPEQLEVLRKLKLI